MEIWPETIGFVITPDKACDIVWRRMEGGSEAKLFLLSCHERLREEVARLLTSVPAPSLCITRKEEELEDGGVGYAELFVDSVSGGDGDDDFRDRPDMLWGGLKVAPLLLGEPVAIVRWSLACSFSSGLCFGDAGLAEFAVLLLRKRRESLTCPK